ncbi:hypothetical protein [Bifidobacterium subtile]|uniref:Cell division protein FtsL n=1 Tax=Bifidobacterium subtile TaxID=77635 RepID=A0A087DTY3_9BIFI|nr:hypothetical protein [Bifidobacterium subtile]KFI98983.1 hypothetical protein BISU_2184 [Bifidobacterium subtile]MCI1222522.1 hypothetical protein [Bifidobacterium subtile]MCI1258169.1 hypothetical protein [Bifidobacterium subtile]QOL36988.1 hypothetical protein BS3272_03320 [Bifidobacterium subtile]
MATSARTVRSNAAPAGRERESKETSRRPELTVIKGRRTASNAVGEGFERLLTWTRARSMPLLQVVVAVAFLAACLLGSLALRTQMAQNSFEQTRVQDNISTLTQDVQDDQAKLDELEASLPQKAQDMGMVPQQGSISIDLSGYQPSKGAGHE